MKRNGLADTGQGARVRLERRVSDHLPVAFLLAPDVLATKDGDLIGMIALDGLPDTTAGVAAVNERFALRARHFRNMGAGDVGVYVHMLRRKAKLSREGAFQSDFAARLDAAWMQRVSEAAQYRSEHYLSVVVRGVASRPKKGGEPDFSPKRVARLREFMTSATGDLADYGARVLKVGDDGRSAQLSVLSYLLNGEWRPVAAPRQNLGDAISGARISFGAEAIELRAADRSRFAAVLSLKEYPPELSASALEDLLTIRAEFAISQSFTPVHRDAASRAIELQIRRMTAADDKAVSLRDDLERALDDVASSRIVFGHHHLTITVYADTLPDLNRDVSELRSAMTKLGLVVKREDMNLEAAFWAMQPGNMAYRARKALISSDNFAALTSFVAAPKGDERSVWGPSITVFETMEGSPYDFNFHVADVGNTVVFGPTGAGKTALLSFLIAQAERVAPRVIVIDKDRGAEILVRALGGRYVAIEPGEDARLNPFMSPAGAGGESAQRAFLSDWLTGLLFGDAAGSASPQQLKAISAAVAEMRDAPEAARRLDLLRQSLGGGEAGPELVDRLSPWVLGGDKAWAFNSANDQFGELFANRVIGVDVTKILDDGRVSSAFMAYLFHQIEDALRDGRPTLIVLDEAWRLLSDAQFAARIRDWMKVIRKLNGAVIFATQEPEDAIAGEVGRTVIQQSPTQILLPNMGATEAAYCDGLHVTRDELATLRAPDFKAERYFLIRRAGESVIVKFDLGGLPEFIPVLSARASTTREVDHLRRDHGDDPAAWLPEFMRRHGGKQ